MQYTVQSNRLLVETLKKNKMNPELCWPTDGTVM